MSRRQLTQKQHAFLEYLVDHVGVHRVWPTYREIVGHFGYRSPNSVTQNLQALAKKGFLRRDDAGYQLADHLKEGRGIPLEGHIEEGEIVATAKAKRLALADLVPGLDAARAYEIGEQPVETETLSGSTHVLLGEGDVERGGVGVVLLDGRLVLRRVYPYREGWRLEALNGKEVTNHATPEDGPVRVLGPYAGHAGPFGLVCAPLAFMHPEDVVTNYDAQRDGETWSST
ncbi:MAG: repressor LexA [Bacteroidota bacterium]